jgi:hypothetical protein
MSDAVEARLNAHGFRYEIENVQYRDASHLLMGYGKGITWLGIPLVGGFYFGGSEEGTRIARDAGWAKAKELLAHIESGRDRTAAIFSPAPPLAGDRAKVRGYFHRTLPKSLN